MDNKQSHAGEQPYDENFYRARRKAGLQKSATEVLAVVGRFIYPRSIVDLGCGTGEWLAAWKNLFGAEIF